MDKNRQSKVDAKAVREKKAVGADDQGGQNEITPGQRVKSDQIHVWGSTYDRPKFRGIRHHGG